ncbi:MAG: M36 family metallopeptidase [Magnetococcus sp. YQC-5]
MNKTAKIVSSLLLILACLVFWLLQYDPPDVKTLSNPIPAAPSLGNTPGTLPAWTRPDPLSLPPAFQFASALNTPQPVTKSQSTTSSPPSDIESVALEQLRQLAPQYHLNPTTLSGARLGQMHDTGEGGIIAKFKQYVGDIEIFRNEMNLLFDREQNLVAVSGHLSPHVEAMEQGGVYAQRVQELQTQFQLSPQAALGKALQRMGGPDTPDGWHLDHSLNGYEYYRGEFPNASYLPRSPARLKKVFFSGDRGVIPAYYMELTAGDFDTNKKDTYSHVISAVDGEILFAKNLKSHASVAYRVYAQPDGDHAPMNSPLGNHGIPNLQGAPSTPAFVPNQPVTQNLITLQSGPLKNKDPWLPDQATTTSGNNVDAKATISISSFQSELKDSRVPISSANTFDYIHSSQLGPFDTHAQGFAAIVQMFYTTNYLHDWFYDVGFDEAAGNGQKNNFGRGGFGGDPLIASLQDDVSSQDNASITVPADGGSPEMEMSLWSGSSAIGVQVNQPSEMKIAKVGRANFGPKTFTLTGQLVRLVDGVAPVKDGCETPTNAAQLKGKIALIDRGFCFFADKVRIAQAAGALGVLIVDQKGEVNVITMIGDALDITIPALFLLQNDGATLDSLLAKGDVNVTLSRFQANDRVGSMDTSVVAHEWGHFINERLIGNGNGLGNNQGQSMGEGWADFHALLLEVRPEESPISGGKAYRGIYPVASYALSNAPEEQPYYYGTRRVPYSIDFAKNALTFKHIQNGVALPTTHPVKADSDGNSEVHNAGEIWATALWEVYAALLQETARLSFAEAQLRMKRYLVASYKMTPMDPTFTEARDALLAVAKAHDLVDYAVMKAAFARRGLGVGAVSPSRYSKSHTGIKESFTAEEPMSLVKATLVPKPGESCDQDSILDIGEKASLTVILRNDGSETSLPFTATLTSANDVQFSNGGMMSFPATAAGATVTSVIEVSLKSAKMGESLKVNVAFGRVVTNHTADTFTWPVHYDLVPAYKQDLLDKPTTDWVFENVNGTNAASWAMRSLGANGPWEYWGNDFDYQADIRMISPVLHVGTNGTFRFRFDHHYSFEEDKDGLYDGGVVEIRVDDGPWQDLGTAVAYTGTLLKDNPVLGSRRGFVGTSVGFPADVTETVDLGSIYNGHKVQIRFRIGSDQYVGGQGWVIRNIRFENITNLPFTAQVANVVSCGQTTEAPKSPAMQGIVKGIKSGEMIKMMAISPDNKVQKSLLLMGNGGNLSFRMGGLVPQGGYRLQVVSVNYWNGYWGGQLGSAATSVVSKALSNLLDLSGGDVAGITLRLEDRTEVAKPDRDADGWPDDQDNCPESANVDQLDTDANGRGDACEVSVVKHHFVPTRAELRQIPGQGVLVSWVHTASDGSKAWPGTGIQIHFDANQLQYVGMQPMVLENGIVPQVKLLNDVNDEDHDPLTGKMVRMVYGTSTVPVNSQFSLMFDLLSGVTVGKSTQLNLSLIEPIAGFFGVPVVMQADAFHLDQDSNGVVTPLSDGMVIMRHLSGIKGDALLDGLIDPSEGGRLDATAIHDRLENASTLLDVDCNGLTDGRDGLLILRYLFGFRGETLSNGYLDLKGCRAKTGLLEGYLNALK